MRVGDPGAVTVISDLGLMGKKRQGLPHCLCSAGILPYHDIPALLSPEGMHEGELRDRQSLCNLFPVSDGINLPLEGPDKSHCNDVREVFIFKCLDELFQIEPAVGNNPRNLDVSMNTRRQRRRGCCSRRPHCRNGSRGE